MHSVFVAGEDERAFALLDELEPPYVIKTDGLAAGKGVVVTESVVDARDAVRAYLSGDAFGDAGRTCVIEEGLVGPEISVFALCDGRSAALIGVAQDHKRAFDGDEGPNTGGMGAYSPVPFFGSDDGASGDDATRSSRRSPSSNGAARRTAACCSAG